jgi:hypothetical protein
VVRVQEILQDQYGHSVPYSTLTRIVQSLDLREEKKKQRSGTYEFGPGQEMQHDTSPHGVLLDGKKVKAQCAGLVLGYSKKLFIQYYPSFTRFEARVFLDEAFKFMDGACPSCIIDNTSVLVAHGSGPEAEIAPEMERFGQIFGVKFIPHAIGDADRKAKMERNFFYVERNFLAGRTFTDWQDLNEQAKRWCMEIANQKVKRSLGISPEAAYLMEKPHLTPLPPYIPPVYQTIDRTVDVAGYVQVDTNRYSVPERLIGKEVEVHKLWDRVEVFFKNQKVADLPVPGRQVIQGSSINERPESPPRDTIPRLTAKELMRVPAPRKRPFWDNSSGLIRLSNNSKGIPVAEASGTCVGFWILSAPILRRRLKKQLSKPTSMGFTICPAWSR